MSDYPPRFPIVASPGDETFDRVAWMPRVRRGLSTSSITERDHPLYFSGPDPTLRSFPNSPLNEGHPWSCHDQCCWRGGVNHSSFVSTTPEDRQAQHNFPLRAPTPRVSPEWPPTFPSHLIVNEVLSNNIASVSHPTYFPNPNDSLGHGDTTSASLEVLRPNSADKPLTSFMNLTMGRVGCHLDEPNANRNLSHAATPHQNAPDDQNIPPTLGPSHLGPHRPFESSSPYFLPHLKSTETFGSAHRIRSSLAQDLVTSSCRKRGARAIYFGGLWVDEDELVKALSGSDGKLNVLQCLWDVNRSPCGLWIKGDKSSINIHIQRWHGGKPGGDKLEVECFWSDCETTMLKESVPRHIVSVHLREMWECQGCGKGAARYDVHRRHTALSSLEACRTSGALITYSADVRVIDVRAALGSGGKVRHAIM